MPTELQTLLPQRNASNVYIPGTASVRVSDVYGPIPAPGGNCRYLVLYFSSDLVATMLAVDVTVSAAQRTVLAQVDRTAAVSEAISGGTFHIYTTQFIPPGSTGTECRAATKVNATGECTGAYAMIPSPVHPSVNQHEYARTCLALNRFPLHTEFCRPDQGDSLRPKLLRAFPITDRILTHATQIAEHTFRVEFYTLFPNVTGPYYVRMRRVSSDGAFYLDGAVTNEEMASFPVDGAADVHCPPVSPDNTRMYWGPCLGGSMQVFQYVDALPMNFGAPCQRWLFRAECEGAFAYAAAPPPPRPPPDRPGKIFPTVHASDSWKKLALGHLSLAAFGVLFLAVFNVIGE